MREHPDTAWALFYDSIEGFEFEPGCEYTVRVAIRRVDNPPADGSSLAYRLLAILRKAPLECRALYARANGTVWRDDLRVRFWSLKEVLVHRERLARTNQVPPATVAFADAWDELYYFVLDPSGMVHISAEGRLRVAGTFEEFIQLYWTDPRSLGLNERDPEQGSLVKEFEALRAEFDSLHSSAPRIHPGWVLPNKRLKADDARGL